MSCLIHIPRSSMSTPHPALIQRTLQPVMALTVANTRMLCYNYNTTPSCSHFLTHLPPTTLSFTSTTRTRTLHLVLAKKFSPRTGNQRGASTTKEQRKKETGDSPSGIENIDNFDDDDEDDGFVMPKLPGDEPDFWEGPQWDGLGFFVQYMWAFGIVFALVACGIAVATYNQGATDFRETAAYKESVQSQELLEGPEASNSDVFESNPTEVAPSLE